MVGMSRSVRDGTARAFEFLLLGVRDGRLAYHAEPSGQAPTDFPVVSLTEGHLRAENPEHDFPQRIENRRVGADSLVANVY